jgi:hypothetical protein
VGEILQKKNKKTVTLTIITCIKKAYTYAVLLRTSFLVSGLQAVAGIVHEKQFFHVRTGKIAQFEKNIVIL